MRVRSRWLAGAACLALSSVAATTFAREQGARQKFPSGSQLSLPNGVTVSSACDQSNSATPVQHITFSARSSHTFLGYGVNVQAAKAAVDIPRTIDDLHKLGFVWVRTSLGKEDGPAQPSLTDTEDEADADTREQVADTGAPSAQRRLYAALHAAGIKVVAWIGHPPMEFFDQGSAKNGKQGRRIKEDAIARLAQYYANYLRTLTQQGVHADLVELINEPNLGQNGKYRPELLAQLVAGVEKDLNDAHLSVGLAAPGTAARIPRSARFVEAMQRQGALAALKAISIHTYYVRDKANGPPVPPADDTEFQSLVTAAHNQNLPLISTEFGGTDVKTKKIDLSRESVDAAEELKAALDLIRAGESAAIVWNLYPNHNFGGLMSTWALIDDKGPTNAYWPFYILSRKVLVGSDVLAIEHSDVSAAFTSLGYAAFRSGHHTYIGLSNPARVGTATIALDLSHLGPVSLSHVASFVPAGALDKDAKITLGTCPLTVRIPNGTGAVLDLDQLR